MQGTAQSEAALPTGGAPTARRTGSGAALALASFGALLAFLDVTIVNVAFPDIQTSFPKSSYSALSWVLNSYNIVFAALLVASGRLADVFGRRRTFTAGVVVFTLASVLCAAAPSVLLLVAARILQAVGAGLLVPASLGLVIEAFPADRRSHAVGIWGATAAFASGIGPPLGGALVELQSWRLAFLVNLPLGVVAVLLTNRVLVESRAPGRRRMPDLRGAALLGLAMASLTLAVTQGPEWGWGGLRVIGALVVAALLTAAFAWSNATHPVPVLDPALLRVPTFLVGNLVTFLAGMGFYAYMLNNVLWLHYVWGYGLLRSGLSVAPGAVVAAVVAGVLGKVADKRGHRVVAVPGALIWAGAYAWFVNEVGTTPHFLTQWLPGQALSGLGVGMVIPIVAAAALEAVPGGRYATASAVVSSARQLGAVIGVAVLVDIVGSPAPGQAVPAFRHAWTLSLGCFLLVALVATQLRRQPAREPESASPPAAPGLRVAPVPDPAGADQPVQSPLLATLPPQTRRRLLEDGEQVVLEAGQWLFRAGEPTDAMYVVRSGRLEVVGDTGVVRELGAGDVVGELGVLTQAPRSAGVRARRDSVLARITPDRVDALLDADPAALRALTRSLAVQVASQAPPQARPTGPRVVAVVGVGDGAPVQQVADELARYLGLHLSVLTSRSLTPEQLHAAEPEHDRVLLVSDDPREPWHAFCLRQADRLVVVAATTSEPPPLLVPRSGTPTYLLRVGAAPSTARTVAWHDALEPRASAVALPDQLDAPLRSFAARLAGRSLGVAVAGGGARSFSAIGVIEELAAAGFVVDRWAGCSVGSVVAAMFASGLEPAAVDAACFEEFVRRNPFNDYRLPSTSLVKGRKAEAALDRYFGDLLLEQLPLELSLVSTDLLSRELVVHRRGRVADAVRASLSLPGLFPPSRIGETLHVDGGILDNLPVAPLAELDEGPVLAIDISAAASSRTRTGPPRMPSLGETLMRTMLMGGSTSLDEARRLATIVVTPDTRGIGLLEFHQLDRAREAGRVAGAAVLPALREHLADPMELPAPRDPERPAATVPPAAEWSARPARPAGPAEPGVAAPRRSRRT